MDLLQEQATKTIRPLIPRDAEERVSRAVKQLNAPIRDQIRAETGLRLSDGGGRAAIHVKIVDGFTVSFAHLIDRYPDPVLWRLICAQPRLGGIIEGLQFLLDDWQAFERWPKLPPVARGSEPALSQTRDVAHALQQVVIAKKVHEEIRTISEDILGCYFFPKALAPWVEIYWMPIALFAAMINVNIEDLTAVTLTHELAHGYTHLGRDIDGDFWTKEGFGESGADVVEGLAQFYTDVITKKLIFRAPGAHNAYARFLELQGGPYVAHTKWLEDSPEKRSETVRFTMLAGRQEGAITHDRWKALLAETASRLKRRKSPPKQ